MNGSGDDYVEGNQDGTERKRAHVLSHLWKHSAHYRLGRVGHREQRGIGTLDTQTLSPSDLQQLGGCEELQEMSPKILNLKKQQENRNANYPDLIHIFCINVLKYYSTP